MTKSIDAQKLGIHRSTKTFTHEVGLSCAFRQWRAESHCSKLHGYALQVSLEFCAEDLDECGWVQDFGGLKPIKAWLELMFDHKTVVAFDDPHMAIFVDLNRLKIIDVTIVYPGTGCENFAMMIYDFVDHWLGAQPRRVQLVKVEVREHGGNSGIYSPLL